MRKEIFVSKRLYRWEQILVSVFSQPQRPNKSQQKLSSRQISSILSKGLLVLVFISLWYWDWQILISAGVGLGLMRVAYQGFSPQWTKSWQNLSRLLVGYNRKLALTLGSGVLGGLSTYLATTVWAETENPWLAFSSILQGLVSLATLTLLGWHVKKEASHRQNNRFSDLLAELTAQDDLKRLIAIHQLTEMANQRKLSRQRESQLRSYFQLMLNQSQEAAIQDALIDCLDILDLDKLSLAAPNSPQKIKLKQPLENRLLLEIEK